MMVSRVILVNDIVLDSLVESALSLAGVRRSNVRSQTTCWSWMKLKSNKFYVAVTFLFSTSNPRGVHAGRLDLHNPGSLPAGLQANPLNINAPRK